MAGHVSRQIADHVVESADRKAPAAVIGGAAMYPRIKSVKPLPDLMLSVIFDDGQRVLYDVKEDLHLPGYSILQEQRGLFEQVQLDTSRTVVYWSEDVDLPSDSILEYGKSDIESDMDAVVAENLPAWERLAEG